MDAGRFHSDIYLEPTTPSPTAVPISIYDSHWCVVGAKEDDTELENVILGERINQQGNNGTENK